MLHFNCDKGSFGKILKSFKYSDHVSNVFSFYVFTQPVNICPQDVPRTSLSNVLRALPEHPIWPSNLMFRERFYLTFAGPFQCNIAGTFETCLFIFSFFKPDNKLKCTVVTGICSYSINGMLVKTNFSTYTYLKHNEETILTKQFLDALAGHFCSQ